MKDKIEAIIKDWNRNMQLREDERVGLREILEKHLQEPTEEREVEKISRLISYADDYGETFAGNMILHKKVNEIIDYINKKY